MTGPFSTAADTQIRALEFPEWTAVGGLRSIAHLYPPQERCGIYVLGFATGERYVGQAVDVTRRFAQHLKSHHDITHLTFRQVAKKNLNEVERHCIHTLEEHGLILRNLAHMSVVQGERDIDLLVSPEEQEIWLEGRGHELQDAEQNIQDDALRHRYHHRFEQFLALPHAQDALFLLGLYLQMVVPFPRRTELSFWVATCLPGGVTAGPTLYCRVSLNMQEVFSLQGDEQGLYASLHLAASPFVEELGNDWLNLLSEEGWEVADHQYRPGGHDQFNLWAPTFETIKALLLDASANQGMALMNMRLMRKGATYYGRSHCLDLVDAALQVFEARKNELNLDSA
ncbi:GIY-YIG nuclease family protein [Deinococcus radiomollis]|uniref:GIY-YIG nuclease family protein n=1 Tax=Deinococcus radiomollis TaxID=468916 RepID=UPI0038919FF6